MDIDWRLIFLIAVIIHAIGHFLPGFLHTSNLLNLSKLFGSAPSNESWLLNGQLKLETSQTKILSFLFLITSIGFSIVAGAFWLELDWWKVLAVPLVVVSFFLFVSWASSFPINIPIGAFVGNIVVLLRNSKHVKYGRNVIMRILVTYRTRTGNTKKIAEAIFSEITVEKEIKSWDLVKSLDSYEYTFVGFPIERMGPIEKDINWLNENTSGKRIILFVTHGAPEQAPYLPPWLDKCREAVTNAGAELLGLFNSQGELSAKTAESMANSGRPDLEKFAQFRHMTLGQPDESRIQAAKAFTKDIMKSILTA